MAAGRRILPPVPRITGRTYNDIAAELQRFLDALTESEDDGVPAGFRGTTPTQITPDSAGSSGSESEGWAAALHDHPITTATPSGLSNSNSEGSATSFLRSDAGIKRDVRVQAAGSDIGTRNALNFVDGYAIDFTATDNSGSDRVDVTAVVIPVVLSPAQIVATTNDYAPGRATFYRLSTDASRDITGLVAGVSGEDRTAVNVGAQPIVLKHQNAGSAAPNRFLCGGAADITLAADEIAMMWYDATTARWRVVKA